MEYPVFDSLGCFFAEWLEFQVVGKGATPLYDVRETARAGEMHCVHVHFRKQWGWGFHSQWNGYLFSLSYLTQVAGLDEPGYILAHIRPPEPLC